MKPEKLIELAIAVREQAYAPYSNYLVGATLLSESGKTYSGCNVENASYGLTVCAERNAYFQAVAAGDTKFSAIAVVTENGGSMCGACRQVAAEFGLKTVVYLSDSAGNFSKTSVGALLPGAFDSSSL